MDGQEAASDAGKASPRCKTPDRDQVDPDPKVLDELIPPDHAVRSIWAMVLEMNLAELYAKIRSVEGHAGRPATDPRVLVALWIFATIEGISSARKLAELCYEWDPLKWLRGGVPVNYHTLADFRVAHGEWLQKQFVAIAAALMKEGLVDLNQVGQDGMRVRASAGAGSFKRAETLDEHLNAAQEQWDQLQKEFDEGTSQATVAENAARERAAFERLERLKRAKEECQRLHEAREARKEGDGKKARASETDPDAHTMKMPDGGFRPAFNFQFSTTLDTLVIVAVDVTMSGSDGGQMGPMVEQIKENLGQVPNEHMTDGGFSCIGDIDQVEEMGSSVFTPVKEAERQQKQGKDPFAPRKGDSPRVAEWRQRMGTDEGKTKYRERSKCEWTNAGCRNRGLYQVLVRGLEKVRAVAYWHALAHNLMRAIALRAQAATA